ncbi:hypothetical protein [Labedaea rhizosphaerae]|uniref:hypothetical protein n=1 Tax=Labedaea rhizosphaerae TaxID=598644 RepID=UPI00105F5EAA|nr:hypothetical protein [Labedaea rhizosphaerae]
MTAEPIDTTATTAEHLASTDSSPPDVETDAPRHPPQAPVTVAPTRGGALVITIKMGNRGKIGPSEFRAGATPGANVDVYDDVGQLSQGCYPSWVLTRGGVTVQTSRNERCTSGGITMFNFGDSLDAPGSYRLSVTITTDSGQAGTSSVAFTVT